MVFSTDAGAEHPKGAQTVTGTAPAKAAGSPGNAALQSSQKRGFEGGTDTQAAFAVVDMQGGMIEYSGLNKFLDLFYLG